MSMHFRRAFAQKEVAALEDKRTQAVYMKVYYQIIEEIINGGYGPGAMLPTQNEFAERFGVSRVTIREAIKELSHRGIVEAVKGRGTTVLHPPQELGGHERQKGLSQNNGAGFDQAIYSRVISIEVVPADDRVSKALRVPPRTLLTRIMRVRISGQRPACLDDVYLLNKYVRDINFFEADLETGSLYALLKAQADITFDCVEERFRAVGCPRQVATWLEIKAGEPVMQTQRLSFDEFGRVIEYCESYQRSDLYYSVIRSRGGLGGSISAAHHSKILGCLIGAAVGGPREFDALYRFAAEQEPPPDAHGLALMVWVGLANPGDIDSACKSAAALCEGHEEAVPASAAIAAAVSCAVKRDSTIEETVQAGLAGARHRAAPDGPEENMATLVFAALQQGGGSFSDVLQAAGDGLPGLLAGALAGAILGEESIPTAWREKAFAAYDIGKIAADIALRRYSGV